MTTLRELIPLLEYLAGEKIELKDLNDDILKIKVFTHKEGIGYSQFNEILLLVGIDRICEEFFEFICIGGNSYKPAFTVKDIRRLEQGIEEFTKMALLFYGNVKFAFQVLSMDKEVLDVRINKYLASDIEGYTERHSPLIDIIDIEPEDSYLLGYYIESDLEKRIENNPADEAALALESKRKAIVEVGKKNDIAYLASDHLDVYVATSMRKPHEFAMVNRFVKEISKNKELSKLKLRIFNPTLAYCNNRIDKGLSEALMLKRAKCTIYLAQESETLGKDSELASTLAQGKVVIAFVPEGNKDYVDNLLNTLIGFNGGANEKEIIIEQLKIFKSDLAWSDKVIQSYFSDENSVSTEMLKEKLYTIVEKYYDDRASGLKDKHPLGIQVNLESGVANGVLVARTEKDCVFLLKDIINNTLEFTVERNPTDRKGNVLENYIYLTEVRTGSIYRVKSGHDLLTTSFWNYYNKDNSTDQTS